MASLKDAQKVVQDGVSAGWGHVVQLPENKRREGLGFSPSPGTSRMSVVSRPIEDTFYSAGFIHPSSEANAISEDSPGKVTHSFVTPGGDNCNWAAVDIPFVAHVSK
jgi:hypothetical protein